MRFVPYLLALSLGPVLAACSSSTATTDVIPRPELVAVDPNDFLGTLKCGTESGNVQSYVATLFDVTPPADGGAAPTIDNGGVALASSPATACTLPVTFSYVAAGRRYLAAVDAYDRKLGELHPSGAEGARTQLDANNAPVTPTWSTLCGAYPKSDLDGGTDAGYAATAALDAGTAETAAAAAPAPIVSYAGLTQTTRYCGAGLAAVQAP